MDDRLHWVLWTSRKEDESMATQTADTRSTTHNNDSPTLIERIRLNGGFLPYQLVAPTMLLILVIAVYPMIDSLVISLQDNPLVPSAAFVGLANYVQVLGDPIFRSAIGTTLLFT